MTIQYPNDHRSCSIPNLHHYFTIKILMHMQEQNLILDKLTEIANKLDEQNILQKTVLNLSEAAKYLDISESHLYKLTSTRQIPHFCPQGKKLYFRREELDQWLQRNRQSSSDEIDREATNYLIKNKRR